MLVPVREIVVVVVVAALLVAVVAFIELLPSSIRRSDPLSQSSRLIYTVQ